LQKTEKPKVPKSWSQICGIKMGSRSWGRRTSKKKPLKFKSPWHWGMGMWVLFDPDVSVEKKEGRGAKIVMRGRGGRGGGGLQKLRHVQVQRGR